MGPGATSIAWLGRTRFMMEMPGITPSRPDIGGKRPRSKGPGSKGPGSKGPGSKGPRSKGPRQAQRVQKTSRKATVALGLGLTGIVLVWVPVLGWATVATGLGAMVFGFLGKREIHNDETLGGSGTAIAGILLGIIQLVLLLVVVLS